MNTNSPDAIALFGGTFDPIHYGHINPIVNVAKALELDQIVLLPAHIPPHKAKAKVSSLHRKAMLSLVCQDYSTFTIDDRELHKDSPSYTVETLLEYRQLHPTAKLYFCIGMDSLLSFTTWYKWQEILKLSNLIVTVRPGYDLADITPDTTKLLSQHQVSIDDVTKAQAGKIAIIASREYDISSTEIRQLLIANKPINQLTTDKVCQYICEHQLYTQSE